MKLRSVIFGGIVTLALSLLASCSDVAESGSATFKIDTSKLLSRAVSLADDTAEEESGTVDIEVYADVFCTSGSSSFKRKATILTESYSIEEYKNIQNENEGKASEALKSFTVDDLPVGKTVSFKVKIYSKSTTTYSATGNSEPVEEIIAISTNEPSAKIGADTEVNIKVGDYDISLDWEAVKFTINATFPNEMDTPSGGKIYVWKKVDGHWLPYPQDDSLDNSVSINYLKQEFDENGGSLSGASTNLSVGDTIAVSMRLMAGNVYYVATSREYTIKDGVNTIELGTLENSGSNSDADIIPAPITMLFVKCEAPYNIQTGTTTAVTDKYATLRIYPETQTDETLQSELAKKDVEISYDESTSTAYFSMEFTDLDDKGYENKELVFDIQIYSDSARETLSFTAGEKKTKVFFKNACIKPYFYLTTVQ